MRRRPFLHTILFPICLIALACLAGTPNPPPGEGEKAERGYAACEPISAVLEAYRQEQGGHPQALFDLFPGYQLDIPTEVNNEPSFTRKPPPATVCRSAIPVPGSTGVPTLRRMAGIAPARTEAAAGEEWT